MTSVKRYLLQCSGIRAAARWLSSGLPRVIMYHNFCASGTTDPDALSVDGIRAQFDYLQSHFRVVPLLSIAQQVGSGMAPSPYSVALTIDDGRRNCYEFFFPLLKEFGFPATFFVVTSFIAGRNWIWTDKVQWLSEHCPGHAELEPRVLPTTFQIMNRMRPEARDAKIHELAMDAGLSLPARAPDKYSPCTWAELREMIDSGLIEIGSHTVDHPILSSITDEESWEQLANSRAQIEQILGAPAQCFCFPNGMPGDFRNSQLQQVRDAGYACAVRADFGFVRPGQDPFQLKRIGMARKTELPEIAQYLDGPEYFRQKIRGTDTSR